MKAEEFQPTVRFADYNVVSSGVVHIEGGPLEFVFDALDLVVRFTFIKDKSNTSRFDGSVQDENTLEIALSNVESTDGEGRIQPVHIADLTDGEFYVTWFISTIRGTQFREFNYTFLLKGN